MQFVYVDQDTPAVVESVEFINERQKVEISVEKQDAENGSTIAGAEFGLYAKEDIKAGGKVIVKADEQLCTAVTGEDGISNFLNRIYHLEATISKNYRHRTDLFLLMRLSK